MLVLKTYIRASGTAPIALQSYSTSFVQLQYFQMRGGSKSLFLNTAFDFCKGEKLPSFFSHASKPISTSEILFWRAIPTACRAGSKVFLDVGHGDPLVLPWARRRRLRPEERLLEATPVRGEQQFRTRGAVHPSAGSALAATETAWDSPSLA